MKRIRLNTNYLLNYIAFDTKLIKEKFQVNFINYCLGLIFTSLSLIQAAPDVDQAIPVFPHPGLHNPLVQEHC